MDTYTIRGWRYPAFAALAIFMTALLIACGGPDTSNPPVATPAVVRVNGFGTAANHVHALLALPQHVLILAMHYGLFRSEDAGSTWQEVAGGSHQLMDGLMSYALAASPLDGQRLYVLTQPSVSHYPGTPGLYTSADQGRTWKLSSATAQLTSGNIFTEAAGNDTPDEVYIYLPALGALGLRVSMDAGVHFSMAGTLPFGRIDGMLPIPGAPGHLLAYGSDGMASSSNGGTHWQVIQGLNGGIYSTATAGPHSPIYASGDAGVFVSSDGGKTFKPVNAGSSFASLCVSPVQPRIVYGKTGLLVYRSTDGGHTWKALPQIKGNLASLAADPANATEVYLSLSYPSAMYRLQGDSPNWQSLTPAP
ncbi:MAG: sialidase family protein [Ktedonobacteraceae bacterium]